MNHSKRSNALLYVFASAILALIPTGFAAAQADTSPPELVDFSFSPTSVDVTAAPQPVTFHLQIHDPLAGYRGGIMTLLSASGQHQFYISFWDCPPVSGNYNDGICEILYWVPQFIESGIWRIVSLDLVDRIGNGSNLSYDQLAARGFPNELLVVRNQPPTANAGADQTVECANPSGTPVRLDGSLSSDPNAGDTLTYRWTGPFSEGGGFASGVSPMVTLPLGSHTITLTVDDGNGGIASDTVAVTVGVSVAGLLPPLAELAPEGQLVPLPPRSFKAGGTLPLKLLLYCGSSPLTGADVAPPMLVGLIRWGTEVDIPLTDADSGQANDNGVLFRYSDGNWVFNLSTKNLGLTPGTYTITIEMPDTRRFSGSFVLR